MRLTRPNDGCGCGGSLPPCGLTWAHIFGELIAIDDAVEALEAIPHGNGSGGFVALVTCPAAEAGDDPTGPGQAIGWMRVLLFACATLQFLLQRMHDHNLLGIEHAAGGRILAAGGARQHELHGDGGDDEGDHGELFERLAVLDHALLDAQPLALERSKQLLDVPAKAVPADYGEG